MNWRKIAFVTAALIILLGGAAALSLLFVSMKPEPPHRPDPDVRRFVKAKTVAYSDIVSPLRREGRVVSSSEVMLVAEASGRIEPGDVVLRKGTSFRKGQLLITVYKDEAELALKARKSNFLTTISILLPDLKIDYPDNYETFQRFFNEIEMDESLPELPEINNEKLKIFLASRRVLNDYYAIKQDEKRLGRHSLYAPFNGTYTQVNYEVGAYINTGGQIARMIRTDQLEVEVPVESDKSKWIKVGDEVKVYSKDNETVLDGSVVRKSDFVEHNTQSRSIFVRVNNTGGEKLLAGEYKEVEFPGQEITQAMVLPRNAVFNSNEVFVVVDGRLKKEEIIILKRNEADFIITGLEEGMKVVAEPLINVKENTPVGILGEDNSPKGNKNQNKQNNQKPQA